MNATQETLASVVEIPESDRGQGPRLGAPPIDPGWSRGRPAGRDPRWKSPALAGVLSLIPGLGQVYIGYYRMGFVHILVWASTLALLAGELVDGLTPLFAVFLVFFYLYNIVDAVRRATLYNHALEGIQGVIPPSDVSLPLPGGSIVGGVLLIGLGALLLSNTLFGISFDWLEEWWPAAPILLGLYLVVRGVNERSGAPSR